MKIVPSVSQPLVSSASYGADPLMKGEIRQREAGGIQHAWYSPIGPAKPFPIPPLKIQPRFGHYCGVCPICLAGIYARTELGKIRELRSGSDIEQESGSVSQLIRAYASEAGTDASHASIGNEDGSRLQPVSLQKDENGNTDLEAAGIAALPRLYDSPESSRYKIDGKPTGTTHPLSRWMMSGLVTAGPNQPTQSYKASEDAPPPPLEYSANQPILTGFNHRQDDLEQGLDIKTMGLYHHWNESRRAKKTGWSEPLLLGLASLTRLKPDELLVPAIRELPGFENIGVQVGCLQNVLGLAARQPELQSVSVLVEPWQQELKHYLARLREKYGFAVQQLTADSAQVQSRPGEYAPLVDDYANLVARLAVPAGSAIYRIPLTKLKQKDDELRKQYERKADNGTGEWDTALLESIALADDTDQEALAETCKWLDNVPNVSGLTVGKGLPELEEAPDLDLSRYDDYQE